ncbi:MAG: SDR family oxidoreductase [Phycisphaerales bacterium]
MAQTYLVTGASRGLGAEFVGQLRARGHTVIAAVRDPKTAGEAARAGARVVALDVSRPESFEAFAASLRGPIDVLLNNAGVATGDGLLAKTSTETYDSVYRTNVVGPALLTRALIPNLKSGSRKMIVNVSSQLGSIADAHQGFSYAYCVSKAALNMLSRQMHLELSRDGFTCIALDPGWNRTDMGGKDATLDPKESVASMVGCLERWGPGDSGKFLRYDGVEERW